MKSLKTATIALVFAIVGSAAVCAQTASRNVSYHSQDIVPIRAKVKYTTAGIRSSSTIGNNIPWLRPSPWI